MRYRSHIYIDGFNLYYGLVKDGPNKWLDLDKYFSLLRQNDEILKIYYFTALVDGPRKKNQEVYLRALRTMPKLEIILGKFMKKNVTCQVTQCTFKGNKVFNANEEKGTDVNIAVRMIDDAYNDRCDTFILVSGDSDLAPVLSFLKKQFPDKKLIVYVPATALTRHNRHSKSLADKAHKYRFLPEVLLAKAQFPCEMKDSDGSFRKPDSW
jgi:uncharacterized LabA/DUF88 family protein